uniref:Solute carrier family 25 member 40 n=1 Tax=Steinernema glaseri TaxID=37863 RepID=A0A1I7YAN8_9BILA
MVASSSGALVTALMMTPMDVVKVRLQQQVKPLGNECGFIQLCTSCADPLTKMPCEWYSHPGRFNGTVDAFVKIARQEGVRSLWSGLSPTIVHSIPTTVFYFSLYDTMLASSRRRFGDSFYLPMFVGAAARGAAVTIVSPLEMVRTKMQSEKLSFFQLRDAVRTTVKHDGFGALWRGWAPTIMRDLPFSALYWTGYEYLKKRALQYLDRKETTFGISAMCGALSGTFAAAVTTPFDVVKTHRQITLGQVSCSDAEGIPRNGQQRLKSQSTYTVIKEIGASPHGYKALFTGLVPRIAKVAPACAVMIGSYEFFKLFFARRNSKKLSE